MRKKLLNILKYLVLFSATGVLLWFALSKIETAPGQSKWETITTVLSSANKFYLTLCVLIGLASHWVRAIRWKILLEPLGYKLNVWHGFLAVMTGYFVNLGVPRGGEIYRCYSVYKMDGVPVDTSIGTVVAERIVDFIFMLIFIAIACSIEMFRVDLIELLSNFSMNQGEVVATEPTYKLYYVGGAFVIFIIGIVVFRLAAPEKAKILGGKIKTTLGRVKDGALAIFKLKRKAAFIGYSWLIWICYCLMTFSVVLAFDETSRVGILGAVTVFTTGGVAMTLPLPGGTGSYHMLVTFVMENFYGIKNAMRFAFIFHAWQTMVIIMVGAFSLIMTTVLGERKKEQTKKQAPTVD